MSWHGYNNDSDDYIDLAELDLGHQDKEDPIVTFEEQPNGQLRIQFDLELVRVHQAADGDVYLTLKT